MPLISCVGCVVSACATVNVSSAVSEGVGTVKVRVAQLTRMLFGQKRERFENPDQPELPFTPSAVEQQ